MNLNKEKWLKKDIIEYETYLKSLERIDKKEWTRNIVCTNLEVLAIKSMDLKKIANQIYKGNYESFLNYNLGNYYEEIIINGYIINKIKDYNLKVKYLNEYIKNDMCWASIDVLKFDDNIKYLELSKEYIKNKNPFIVRLGIIILFAFLDNYMDEVFNILKQIKNDDYYVNMAYAWILCECYIKTKNKTINYIKNNNINKFVINKMISKCNDSFRITKEEKENIKKVKYENNDCGR